MSLFFVVVVVGSVESVALDCCGFGKGNLPSSILRSSQRSQLGPDYLGKVGFFWNLGEELGRFLLGR